MTQAPCIFVLSECNVIFAQRIINKNNIGSERWTRKHSVHCSPATHETLAERALCPYRPYRHPYTCKSFLMARLPAKAADRFW